MTIVKNHKNYKVGETTFFIERYANKPLFVWFWRYGYYSKNINGYTSVIILSERLRSRPKPKMLKFF